MSKRLYIFLTFVVVAIIFSCKKSQPAQNVQNNCVVNQVSQIPVNITILAGSGQFFPISVVGGFTYVYLQSPSKGIVVYRLSQNQFMAFERSCTQDGCNNTKALVWVQTGNTTLKDSICGSTFSIYDGSVQTTPAKIPLYQYHTSWDGNQLHIYN